MKISNAIYALLVLGVTLTRVEARLPPIAAPSATPSNMVANATTVVIGKVTSIEKELVEVTAYVGESKDVPKQTWRVANVKISESLLGAKGLTTIKVGFAENVDDNRLGSNEAERLIRQGLNKFTLTEEQEGVFVLTRHWDGDFYILAFGVGYTSTFFDKKSPDFDKCLAETKFAVKAVKDPIEALKSKDKAERIATAALLTRRYRIKDTSRAYIEEKVSAEESKLILQVMLELPGANATLELVPDSRCNFNYVVDMWIGDDLKNLKFVAPTIESGTGGTEIDKAYKTAITKFLAENSEKITLKKFVEKK